MRRVGLTVMGVWVVFCVGAGAAQAQPRWVQEAAPNPFALANSIFGVSCASPNACESVGTGFLARWDGTTWQQQPDPTLGDLTAVSCARANACTAVGGNLAARWNGETWTMQSPVNSISALAVSCPTVRFCMAVGGGDAESSNGTAWVARPIGREGSSDNLTSVSCSSPSACTAVGSTGPNYIGVPLIERWDGVRWSRQSSPVPPGATGSVLNGVSCTGDARCMAIGSFDFPSTDELIFKSWAELWNGASWRILPMPNPRGPQNELLAISCHTADFCLAVGDRSVGPEGDAYAARWDGRAWALVPAPFGDDTPAVPEPGAVSCPKRNRCQAVATVLSVTTTMSANVAAEYHG